MTPPLIVAIEPDPQQASHVTSIARRLGATLWLVESMARALERLEARLPDLILTPALLSHRDGVALAERLRELGDAAAHIQTLTIPILDTPAPPPPARGMLSALRRPKVHEPGSGTRVVDTFAEQIALYLGRASDARLAPPAPESFDEILLPMAPAVTAPVSEDASGQSGPEEPPDDWRYFNPEQCRFSALLAKLDEITGEG